MKEIEKERERRFFILEKLGMKIRESCGHEQQKPLCCVMFRLGNVYSDVITELSRNDEFQRICTDFEKNYDALIYYGIYSEEPDGKQLALFYIVESEREKWEKERISLINGVAMAYIYNFTEKYDDIVPITIGVRDGIVIRKE